MKDSEIHAYTDACTSYSVCGVLITVQDINWATVGAVVLLIARLIKDVPDAYDSMMKRIRKRKHDKSN